MKLYHTEEEVEKLRTELKENWVNLKRDFWHRTPIIKYIPKLFIKLTLLLDKGVKKIAK